MRTEKGIFFESKVRLEKTTEEGAMAKFNELYVVNAMSFTECESRVTGFVGGITQGDYEVLTEAHARYGEIFFSDIPDDLYYRVKVDFIIVDEKTGKQKHSKTDYLVQGSSVEDAKRNVDEVLKGSMVDYKIVSVSESVIADYINA